MAFPLIVLSDHSVGDQVRLLRTVLHLRQIDLATISRVTQAQVSAIERGDYVPLSIERKILEGLDSLREAKLS